MIDRKTIGCHYENSLFINRVLFFYSRCLAEMMSAPGARRRVWQRVAFAGKALTALALELPKRKISAKQEPGTKHE